MALQDFGGMSAEEAAVWEAHQLRMDVALDEMLAWSEEETSDGA